MQIGQGREQCHVRCMHIMRHEIKLKKEIRLGGGKKKHSGDYIGIAPLLILHPFPFPYFFPLLYTGQRMIILYIHIYIYEILLGNML